jgi:mannose-6-phosphate isomerase-like protein (cupin superfamily)
VTEEHERRPQAVVIIYGDQVAGWVNPPPHERTLKVLLSPDIQPISPGLGMGMVILPPGRSSSSHSHETEQEVWYVVSGRGRVRVGDEEAEIHADTVIVAPPGTNHQLINEGEDSLKAIWLFVPAGPEVTYLPPEEGEQKVV